MQKLTACAESLVVEVEVLRETMGTREGSVERKETLIVSWFSSFKFSEVMQGKALCLRMQCRDWKVWAYNGIIWVDSAWYVLSYLWWLGSVPEISFFILDLTPLQKCSWARVGSYIIPCKKVIKKIFIADLRQLLSSRDKENGA